MVLQVYTSLGLGRQSCQVRRDLLEEKVKEERQEDIGQRLVAGEVGECVQEAGSLASCQGWCRRYGQFCPPEICQLSSAWQISTLSSVASKLYFDILSSWAAGHTRCLPFSGHSSPGVSTHCCVPSFLCSRDPLNLCSSSMRIQRKKITSSRSGRDLEAMRHRPTGP